MTEAYTSPRLTKVSLVAQGNAYALPCFSGTDIGMGYDFSEPAACVPLGTSSCREPAE